MLAEEGTPTDERGEMLKRCAFGPGPSSLLRLTIVRSCSR